MGQNRGEVSDYQSHFIDFLFDSEVLTFGDFVTKSGRKTPYFVNTGRFNSGRKIDTLGAFYAEHLVACQLSDCDTIFGPAYKGIPLAVTTAAALYRNHGLERGYSFDRKEVKDHGDGGAIVGRQLQSGDRVIIVEDVVTAGTTLKAIVPVLREQYEVEVGGVVLAVDRCERGSGDSSAVQEVEEELDVNIFPIVTIHQVVQHLSSEQAGERQIPADIQESIESYLQMYGATT